jgi:uncharacterized protein YndB with AHSA1/START domain
MSTPSSGDSAKVTVFVAVSQKDAFDVFTSEIDQWWRTGPKFRVAGRKRGQLFFERELGGRLFETFEASGGTRTVEVGRVTAWEPPARLVLEWRGVNFKPHEKTSVEVTFEACGDGTFVRVEHSGWAALPADHPARHGRTGAEFSRMLGMWWGDLMTSLREHVGARS